MIYIGIDPGQKGAITAIEYDSETQKKYCDMLDMPLLPEKGIDSKSVFHMLYKLKEKDTVFCVIEKAQSLPSQGSSSGFNYGTGYGKIIAVLEILEIPFEEIRPVKWKKEFSLVTKKNKKGKVKTKEKKQSSVNMAIKLFPTLKKEFYGVKGGLKDGRAESLLLAEYALRKYYKENNIF